MEKNCDFGPPELRPVVDTESFGLVPIEGGGNCGAGPGPNFKVTRVNEGADKVIDEGSIFLTRHPLNITYYLGEAAVLCQRFFEGVFANLPIGEAEKSPDRQIEGKLSVAMNF